MCRDTGWATRPPGIGSLEIKKCDMVNPILARQRDQHHHPSPYLMHQRLPRLRRTSDTPKRPTYIDLRGGPPRPESR